MNPIATPYPIRRSRRLRREGWIRDMVAETKISISDLIWPIFICEGSNKKEPINSLPGLFLYSVDELQKLQKSCGPWNKLSSLISSYSAHSKP